MRIVARLLVLLSLLWVEGVWAVDEDFDGVDDELSISVTTAFQISESSSGPISLSADGRRVALAVDTDGTYGSDVVRVYDVDINGLWQQLGEDLLLDDPGNNSIRLSLSDSGEAIAVGSWSQGLSGYPGEAYIYRLEQSEWLLETKLPNPAGATACGSSLAMNQSGSVVAMTCGIFPPTSVQIFYREAGEWIAKGSPFEGVAYGGAVVSPSGDKIAVPYIGQFIVYEWSESQWRQLGSPVSGGPIALRDSSVIAGDAHDQPQSGKIVVSDWLEDDWQARDTPILGEAYEELLGSVSASVDNNLFLTNADLFIESRLRVRRDNAWEMLATYYFRGANTMSSDGRIFAVLDRVGGVVRIGKILGDLYPSDTDNDSVSNAYDDDDDGDGVPDIADAFPLDASEWLDTDGDNVGNNADTDDDNDGVADSQDDLPLDATESVDTDSDGIGNNADTDDDNDGLSDVTEAELGTDPLKRDTDGDGWSDKEEVDEGTDPLLATSQPELEGGLPIWLLYKASQ